ncbi:hypothetical protein Asppvi_010256 [Aspergillus pseudoviridinutans]|uniref:Efficient mitochondria targeting-associated protein 19 n=1 Tax=Aspergillus pseudoviridinutans TaxID=1517512 RepID=A0A9P3BHC2_9EURO|nr:uncharacterized protein Asppvi_010256 [Aspergillus pseudoviridinutans]GIJ91291.1 hypothetical protein Asppvi_010256 [Aspergillus pseudoviridinutans]
MTSPSASASIWSRKRDLLYLIFFIIHIPTILLVDAVTFLPTFLQTNFGLQLRAHYIATYQDKFAEAPPPWFAAFVAMELFYQTPLCIWAIPALIRDKAMVPVHLLVFGVQAFVTSLTCLVQMWSWEDRTVAQKQSLTMLYGPYVALGAFMALDMVFRLRGRLVGKRKLA